MNAVHEFDSGGIKGLFLIALDLDLTVDVELLKNFDEVGVREAGVLGDLVDEAKELLGGLAAPVTQAHVGHVRP